MPSAEARSRKAAAGASLESKSKASKTTAITRKSSAPALVSKAAQAGTKQSNKAAAKKQKQSIRYEWGGPVGSFFLMLMLPSLLFAFYFVCNEGGCLSLWPEDKDFLRMPR